MKTNIPQSSWTETQNTIERLIGQLKDLRAQISSEATRNPLPEQTDEICGMLCEAEDVICSIIVPTE
jgi:hypothetical protein